MKLYEELKWRGLIKDVAGDNLEEKLNNEKITFYWGTDPTADSLHIGHYSSLVTAKRLAKAGHHPILLVGGATALIGDPRPTSERAIIPFETVQNNIEGIKKQISKILEGKAEVVNNYDWLKDMDLITFLREVGKYINVNYMLNKDIIRRRLDSGITYTEFSYMLLQSLDFLHLHETRGVNLQVAGSDQWGNITAGVDLIRKKTGDEVYAFTMPLVTTKDGKKFGKSEGNALWLDKNKTSSYELYQYLVNVEDEMVIDYLKIFTFLSKEEIEEIERQHKERPEDRLAHKTLAREIITFIHGEEEYNKAIKISEALFSGDVKSLKLDEILIGFKDIPSFEISSEVSLIDMLVNNGVCSSKREAREFIGSGAITINGDKMSDENMIITKSLAIEGKVLVIRRGKKKYFLGKFI